MAKPFDASFFTSAALVVGSLGLAWAALINPQLPIIGSGRGALIAVAVVGMAGCAVGGLSQAPVVGWTHPVIIVGSILGIAALGIILAGFLGWDALLRPIAQLVPGEFVRGASTAQLAIVALAAVITVKWVIGLGWAARRALGAA